MKTLSEREAKNTFGLMIDAGRAEPAFTEKLGRGVVMVISVEDTSGCTAAAAAPQCDLEAPPSGVSATAQVRNSA